jgi:SWI/SNF-related matrix-associated actin-dependent regulator 1 of chromatin subfamily A
MTDSLFEYQKQGIDFMNKMKKCFLLDDPGLGKTVQGAFTLKTNAPNIVVCPASLKNNWQNEINRWRPDLKTRVISGRGSWDPCQDGEVLIINPDILPENISVFGAWSNMRLLVDEAHMFKSHKAQRTKILARMTRACTVGAGSVTFMTGTPVTSNPLDLWGLLYCIDLIPETYGSFKYFVKMFNGYATPFGYKWGTPNDWAMDKLKPWILGRKRENVLKDLPTKIYQTVSVDIKDGNTSEIPEDQIELSVDKQWVPPHLMTWRSQTALKKAEKAKDFIDMLAESEQVVVFSAHKDAAKIIGERDGWACITSDVTSEKRNEIVYNFQQGKYLGIAGTIGAMGVGFTLTKSHHVVMIDRDWSPSMNRQAEDRVCRIGQTRGVIVTDILSDSKLDQIITKVLIRKQKLLTETIEAVKV